MPEQENKYRQSHGKEFIEIFELASAAYRSYVDI